MFSRIPIFSMYVCILYINISYTDICYVYMIFCYLKYCRYHRVYSKRTRNWFVTPIKEAKTYSYIRNLQGKVIANRLAGEGPLQQKAVLGDDDPRTISRTLAGNSPPSTEELIGKHRSRKRYLEFAKTQTKFILIYA